jgi:hypothetical protein
MARKLILKYSRLKVNGLIHALLATSWQQGHKCDFPEKPVLGGKATRTNQGTTFMDRKYSGKRDLKAA